MNEHVRISVREGAGWQEAFTAADFLRMMDAGAFTDMRAELVKGDLQKMMPAYMEHGEYNFAIATRLAEAFRDVPSRIAIDLIIRIDDFTVRAVDIAVVKPGVARRGAIDGADVLLAVELADTTLERDLGEKADDYARAGVAHYWVADLDEREMHRFTLSDDVSYVRSPPIPFEEAVLVPGTGQSMTID